MSATGTGTSDPVSGIGGPAAGGLPEPVLDASGEMSFMDHLGVLRRHITRSMLWFGLAAVIAFVVVGPVWDLMMIPLCDAMPDRCYVYPRDLLESFWVYVKLGCLIAFFVAFPALFAEVWAFVAPGLYATKRRSSSRSRSAPGSCSSAAPASASS
jgi:sec-independent protein translocase protein TatC